MFETKGSLVNGIVLDMKSACSGKTTPCQDLDSAGWSIV